MYGLNLNIVKPQQIYPGNGVRVNTFLMTPVKFPLEERGPADKHKLRLKRKPSFFVNENVD